MNQKLEAFFLSQPEPYKSCLLALRDIMLQKDLAETIKYGMPCFTFNGKALCYLWKDKKTNEPYILFVDGPLLHHPSLRQGDRAKMKVLPVDPESDLPLDLINEVIEVAVSLRQKSI